MIAYSHNHHLQFPAESLFSVDSNYDHPQNTVRVVFRTSLLDCKPQTEVDMLKSFPTTFQSEQGTQLNFQSLKWQTVNKLVYT
jgi:hypothetical protein